MRSGRSSSRSGSAVRPRSGRRRSASTASSSPSCGCPPTALAGRAGPARPGRPGRAGRVDPPGPARARGAAPGEVQRVEVVPGGTVTRRHLPVRPGRALRAGWAGPAAVQRGDERGARPGGRRPVDRARLAAAAGRRPGSRTRPILAACALLGVDEVYAVGGAQAVAMLAYGVAGVEPVDLVTGPGNVYVAAAKRLLRGVGRHRLRGRSERGGRAGRRHRRPGARRRRPAQPGRARPDLAASVLVTDSPALADAVEPQLEPTRWRRPSTSSG